MTNASLMMSAAADLCESSLADLLAKRVTLTSPQMQKRKSVLRFSACLSKRILALETLAKKGNLHPASLLHLPELLREFVAQSFIVLFGGHCCHFPDIRYCKLHKHGAWEINKLIGGGKGLRDPRKLNFAFIDARDLRLGKIGAQECGN